MNPIEIKFSKKRKAREDIHLPYKRSEPSFDLSRAGNEKNY